MMRVRRAPFVKAVLKPQLSTLFPQFLRKDFSKVPIVQRLLMNVPKGFEKFYRSPNSKSDNSKQQPKNDGNKFNSKKDNGEGGNNKNNKKPEDSDNLIKLIVVGGLMLLLASYLDVSVKEGR